MLNTASTTKLPEVSELFQPAAHHSSLYQFIWLDYCKKKPLWSINLLILLRKLCSQQLKRVEGKEHKISSALQWPGGKSTPLFQCCKEKKNNKKAKAIVPNVSRDIFSKHHTDCNELLPTYNVIYFSNLPLNILSTVIRLTHTHIAQIRGNSCL